jgi:DNA-binding response OmpR family regulator
MSPNVDLNTNILKRGELSMRLHAELIEMLFRLNKDAGSVVTRDEIRIALWGKSQTALPKSWDEIIKTYIYQLRRVLPDFGGQIENVRGVGYVLKWDDVQQEIAA